MIKKCAILSMDDISDFEAYDYLLDEPLAATGWQVETISWRQEKVNWDDYTLVVIHTPWDYQSDAEAFIKVLEAIDNSSAHLDNSLDIVRWNIDKKYLRELESNGVEIVPSLWRTAILDDDIPAYFEHFASEQIIIKPCISANADDTFWLTKADWKQFSDELTSKFKSRDCMVQPFMPSILDEGEFSLFYFDGDYSHAILKTPKDDDFRVQEEHGGRLKRVEPEPLLKQLAEKVLAAVDTSLLYARVDFVRSEKGFALMEAELIEPSLYFNLDAESPQRFVDAVERRMRRLNII